MEKQAFRPEGIRLSNGHLIEFVAASGSLGYDGKGRTWEKPLVWFGGIQPKLFTVITKTLTRFPKRSDVKTWNAPSLINPGFYWWYDKIAPKLDFKEVPLVISITGNENELIDMAKKLNDFPIKGIEVNVCPIGKPIVTVEDAIYRIETVNYFSRHPIIAKISAAQDYISLSKRLERLEKPVVEAISIHNIPLSLRLIDKINYLQVKEESATSIQNHNWKAVRILSKRTSIPIICPEIKDYHDVAKTIRLGAKAVSFDSTRMKNPCKPTRIVRKILAH